MVKSARKMNKKQEEGAEVAKNLAEKLLTLMGSTAKVEAAYDEKNEGIVVDIKTDSETGLLIGKRGETLSSLQAILGMMLRVKMGEWRRVIVNIGDYREKQEDYLKDLAEEAAERAIETGEPQSLYNLTAGQRRIIHVALSENKKVSTESQGEGPDRYLIVKPNLR